MKTYLTEKEERAVCGIVDDANLQDGTSYTAPVDADEFYLSCHEGHPVAVLAVYAMGDTRNGNRVEEVLLFTRSEYRGRGRARKLWKKYLEDRDTRELSVRFSAYECAAAAGYLEHGCAVHDHDEVMMKKHLGGNKAGRLKEKDFTFRNDYSECSVKTYGNVGYIYGVRTDTSHLREGSAGKLLEEVYSKLYDMGAADVILEVSSANVPAWKLYRKMGFEVEDTLQIWYVDLS